MLNKNTKFGALKSLAVASFVGACSVGAAQGAITVSIVRHSDTSATFTYSGTIDTLGSNNSHVIALLDVFNDNGGGFENTVPRSSDTVLFNGNPLSFAHAGQSGWDGPETKLYMGNSPNPVGSALSGSVTIDLTQGQTYVANGSAGVVENGAFGTDPVNGSWSMGAAVPEPSSALLASFGLSLLAFRRKRT